MSTDDDLPETVCPRWRLVLLAEPSEDELARHWSLTPADRIEIARCRGDDHRRRFALQLCMLRTHGRFLEDYRQAPLRIVNHLDRSAWLLCCSSTGPDGGRRNVPRLCASVAISVSRASTGRPKRISGTGCARGLSKGAARPSSWCGWKAGCGTGGSCCRRSAPSSGL